MAWILIFLQEGIERTIESYSHLRAEHQPKRDGQSKMHIYLGGGKGTKLSIHLCGLLFGVQSHY